MIDVELFEADELRPRITVIGVGGAGGNAVANMIVGGVLGVEFLVANTDAQALVASPATRHIQLGRIVTQGLGAGSVAAVGEAAAEESREEIERAISGSQMCFIAAGMGGGTGTGAAPVIASVARELGILTVGVVSKPFAFEGARRARVAEEGIEALRKNVDTLIVIPNQNLFRLANQSTTFKDAFLMADEVLQQGVRGITDLMILPGLVNLDFADIRSVMGGMGQAMMGTGEASGDNRALEASEKAISNPLLDGAIKGARGLIISIVGGEDLRLLEIDEAANHIKDLIHPEADIIWGSAINPALEGRMRVSVIATGLEAFAEAPLIVSAKPAVAAIALPIIAPTEPAPAVSAFRPLPVVRAGPADASEPASLLRDELAGDPIIVAPVEAAQAVFAGLLDPPAAAIRPYVTSADDAEEELMLTSFNMQPLLISESQPAAMSSGEATTLAGAYSRPQPRGRSLFERVADMARGGTRMDPDPTVVTIAERTESPGVYNRRYAEARA